MSQYEPHIVAKKVAVAKKKDAIQFFLILFASVQFQEKINLLLK